jgi:hypothetical protein
MKICSKCNKEKEDQYFYIDITHRDKLSSICKECRSEINKLKNFPVSITEKKCPKCNEIKPAVEFHREKRSKDGLQGWCKKCIRIYRKTKQGKLNDKKVYLKRRENGKSSEYHKKYAKTERGKEVQKNADRRRIESGQFSRYRRERRKNDSYFNLICNLRSRINSIIRNNVKSKSTIKLLGCTIDYLKEYLESQFQPGMTWENYGKDGWHIDHIIPCSKFDLSDPYCQKICFNFLNLQPLWEKENCSKGNKFPENYKDLLEVIIEFLESG